MGYKKKGGPVFTTHNFTPYILCKRRLSVDGHSCEKSLSNEKFWYLNPCHSLSLQVIFCAFVKVNRSEA